MIIVISWLPAPSSNPLCSCHGVRSRLAYEEYTVSSDNISITAFLATPLGSGRTYDQRTLTAGWIGEHDARRYEDLKAVDAFDAEYPIPRLTLVPSTGRVLAATSQPLDNDRGNGAP